MNATMNATSTASVSARITALVVAVLTSAVVLGSTVAGMQPRDDAGMQVIALERVTEGVVRSQRVLFLSLHHVLAQQVLSNCHDVHRVCALDVEHVRIAARAA